MLTDDLRLDAIDARHVRGWISLFLPPAMRAAPRWALLVWDGATLVAAVASDRGAFDPATLPFPRPSRKTLRAAKEALGVDFVLVVSDAVFDEIAQAAESSVRFEEHYTAQSLHWLDAVRAANRKGLWVEPPLLDLLPPLSEGALERAFKLFVPDDSSLAAYVLADDRASIVASVIAHKRAGRIARVTSHEALAEKQSEAALARRWTSEYTRTLDLIASEIAPASIALFIERAAVRRILSGPPDQLMRELKNKAAIIDPMPKWLAGMLGGAAAVAVATRSAKRLGGLLPERARRVAAQVAESASRRAKESGAHPWQVLGFDPLDIFRNVQAYYRE